MAPRLRATQIRLLGLVQQLQTVAAEASHLLRNQSIQVLQTQAIRLEDIADTEIEDAAAIDQCMNELMLGILYTEIRKDVRQVSDALDRAQYEALSGRQKPDVVAAAMAVAAASEAEESTEEMVTAETHEQSADAGAEEPQPLSSRSETFQTARGVPMGFTGQLADMGGFAEQADTAPSAREADEPSALGTAEPEASLEELGRRLYGACMEIDEWRRTPCIVDFMAATKGKQADDAGGSAASGSPATSPRLATAPRGLEDMCGRQRAQSSWSTVSSPSRLLQVEREVEAMRAERARSRKPSMPEYSSVHTHGPPANNLSPSGKAQRTHPATLRLIDTVQESSRATTHRTLVDDVRIIGWATRGRGLDVHTEFKIVLHLTVGDNLTVMRRYTDFEVLRDVLCDRYPMFAKRIPHLPRKKAFGKFEDRFLKKRESGLQFFLAYVMLHPVIGCSVIIRQWIEGRP